MVKNLEFLLYEKIGEIIEENIFGIRSVFINLKGSVFLGNKGIYIFWLLEFFLNRMDCFVMWLVFS